MFPHWCRWLEIDLGKIHRIDEEEEIATAEKLFQVREERKREGGENKSLCTEEPWYTLLYSVLLHLGFLSVLVGEARN